MEQEHELKKWLMETLTDAYTVYRMQHANKKVTDGMFARWLNISPTSFNRYVNGETIPEYENAIRMSEKLGRDFIEHLGYGYIVQIRDLQLKFIVQNWGDLDEELRGIIYNHVAEEIQKDNEQRGQVRGDGTK